MWTHINKMWQSYLYIDLVDPPDLRVQWDQHNETLKKTMLHFEK